MPTSGEGLPSLTSCRPFGRVFHDAGGTETIARRANSNDRLSLFAHALPGGPIEGAVGSSTRYRKGGSMGDKSPKSKQRREQQKGAAKAQGTAAAQLKQESQSRASKAPGKAKG
jgi:hypothetical protein